MSLYPSGGVRYKDTRWTYNKKRWLYTTGQSVIKTYILRNNDVHIASVLRNVYSPDDSLVFDCVITLIMLRSPTMLGMIFNQGAGQHVDILS